jgi:hypothetical protein
VLDPARDTPLPSHTIPAVAHELSEQLAAAEHELRNCWLGLLAVSSPAAERFSEASHFVHRAKLLLDDQAVIR